jgi:hypothetical protein
VCLSGKYKKNLGNTKVRKKKVQLGQLSNTEKNPIEFMKGAWIVFEFVYLQIKGMEDIESETLQAEEIR